MVDQNLKKNKIVMTGGHLSPLLAVLSELEKTAEVLVIGRKHTFEADSTPSLEYEILTVKKVPFYNLPAGRLQRKFTKHTIPSLKKLPGSVLSARKILKEVNPDAVLTFGGYVGLPVAVASYSLGIPVILHEQTQNAGTANKLISKIAKKICISYPASEKYFPHEKIVLTGNPVRSEVFKVIDKFEVPNNFPVLFVTGGSTGAHFLNHFVHENLEILLSHFVIIHQTGSNFEYKDFEKLSVIKKSLPEEIQKKYILKRFILPEEIGFVYEKADVVLSRAGANTVSELIALSKKALLIPLPHGQKNEQLENAKFYKKEGLGTYVLQDEVTSENVIEILLKLKSKKITILTRPQNNSAKMISDLVLQSI